MANLEPNLLELYDDLLRYFGAQHWWPALSTFEVIVGAILTQHTAWVNVERAVENLRHADALRIDVLEAATVSRVEAWIRPSGTYRAKAKCLKAFLQFLGEHHAGDLEAFLDLPLDALRHALLSIRGIGPETADCIILYAAGKPSFVVDVYTRRLVERHGWLGEGAAYAEVRSFFQSRLPVDVHLYNEFHALIVALGKAHCRPRPLCQECPLARWLPDRLSGSDAAGARMQRGAR